MEAAKQLEEDKSRGGGYTHRELCAKQDHNQHSRHHGVAHIVVVSARETGREGEKER